MTKAELLKTAKSIRLDTRQVKATLNGTMTEIRVPIKGRFEVCKTKSGEVVDIQRVDDNDRHIGSIKPPYQKGDVLSVHMPREAARTFLLCELVNAEKIKDISEQQAVAEGFSSRTEFMETFLKMYPVCNEDTWSWVINFKMITKNETDCKGNKV